MEMNHLTVETEDDIASLIELAANNDVKGFKRVIQCHSSAIDDVGLWYGRQKGSKQMVLEQRTPLMVAATYGSIDVLKLILSFSDVDVNRPCGLDQSTALHCAASGGSVNAADIVNLLLEAGADPNLNDVNGLRPVDVLVICPKLKEVNLVLEELLMENVSVGENSTRMPTDKSASNSPPLSPSPNNGSTSSASDSSSSPEISKSNELPVSSPIEKKEYPVDPSMPDIKNSIYSTDEFRMFSFKIRPCSRAYSHDWTECPFVHPGENARRRDPRKYHYSCVPCPDFRKGSCRRGDACEYAHGVFECWLHPAQYKTRLCKDGSNCNRRVCFFAHTHEELRPLYVSTGPTVPSPHSSTYVANAMDLVAAMSLLPGSPSAVSAMTPTPFTPSMSPSVNGVSNMGWSQPNVRQLHLPGSNLQSSHLRSSLNARGFPAEDIKLLPTYDIEQQQLQNQLSRLSRQPNSLNRSTGSRTLSPSNLEDIFSAESSSPRYADQVLASAVFSPTHRSGALNQFHQQTSMLSPSNQILSQRTVDHPLLQASFGVSPSGWMSPRNVEPPMISRVSMLAQQEKQQQQFLSLSSRDLGFNSAAAIVGSPADSWSKWGSTNIKPDWAINADDVRRLKRSSFFELGSNGEEPDLSWVHSLVKEFPHEMKLAMRASGIAYTASSSDESENLISQIEQVDQSEMQLDQPMPESGQNYL